MFLPVERWPAEALALVQAWDATPRLPVAAVESPWAAAPEAAEQPLLPVAKPALMLPAALHEKFLPDVRALLPDLPSSECAATHVPEPRRCSMIRRLAPASKQADQRMQAGRRPG